MIEDKIIYNDYWEKLQEKDKEVERLTKPNKALNEMYELTKKEYIRLNNIINELENELYKFYAYEGYNDEQIKDKLQELKGSNKE